MDPSFLIRVAPDPTAIFVGPFSLGWYGLGYVAALLAMLLVSQPELERRAIDRRHFANAMLFVGALALVGARLYHVLDEWELYAANPLAIVLPPYSGLGLYGGIFGALIGIGIYARRNGLPVASALDAVVPGTLLAQGIARWGNFFNQELYGPPTDLPWGITVECNFRVAAYPCAQFPFESTGFHPLFFYESTLDIAGALLALWISRRFFRSLRPGDLVSFWLVWYGGTRTLLEPLREGYNWTVLGDIPTASLIGLGAVVVGAITAFRRHGDRAPEDEDDEEGDEEGDEDTDEPWDDGEADADEFDEADFDEPDVDEQDKPDDADAEAIEDSDAGDRSARQNENPRAAAGEGRAARTPDPP